MNTLVYLIVIAVASFAVLAQPAVAQGAHFTYPAQVLQGEGSQTCPSEEQQERVRNEVDNDTERLLQESVVPLLWLQAFSCGGSTGWRRVAYLNMSDPPQQCPPVWREYTNPHRVCGRRSTSSSGGCGGLNYTTGSEQYDQVCGRVIGYQLGNTDSFLSSIVGQLTLTMSMASVSHVAPSANTFGRSLMVLMNFPQLSPMQHVPVSMGALIETVFPHLWARTISVRQV